MRINEEGKKQAGKMTGGLDRYHGQDLQRMALGSRELPKSVDARVRSAVQLLDAPDPYDEPIDRTIPGHAENEATLRWRRVLVGGKAGELPLQISRENALDAMFCAFIQCKEDWGFGEGNVKAPFESLELDWIRHGVVEDGRRLEISAHRQRA